MDLYDRQLLWTHMFATHPAGFWADLLISVNPIEFGRIAFKYFPNEANQLMINANISITDYFSLIESYPGLGNAYLSNLKNTLMNMGYTAAGWTYLADEHHIYGSSRVGVHNTHFVLAKRFSTAEMEYTQKIGNQVHFIRGKRNYELSNHLGNVQVVISDKRISVCDNELQTERFEADILMATDYYPFGMAIPERQWYTGSDSSNYRFGFNGMENDNEVKGVGNSVDFGARIYDSRLGRWLSMDPMSAKYASITPFLFAINCPLKFVDADGRDFYITGKEGQKPSPADIEFFNLINERCGNVFQLDAETGKVTLIEGKSINDVIGSETVSKEFAAVVISGIGSEQTVYFRTVVGESGFYIDSYISGKVDIEDITAMEDKMAQNVIMTHFIAERFATKNYESVKNTKDVYNEYFLPAHDAGINAEISVLSEMLKIDKASFGDASEVKEVTKLLKDSNSPSGWVTQTTRTYKNGVQLVINKDANLPLKGGIAKIIVPENLKQNPPPEEP